MQVTSINILTVIIISVIMLTISIRLLIANYFIAHALGQTKGLNYTNSKEAFENSYKKGYRNFEVDLTLTPDKKIVCFHRYDSEIYNSLSVKNDFSYSEFMNGKCFTDSNVRFTTLDLNNLIDIMKKYKNIKILLHIQANKDINITKYVLDEITNLVGEGDYANTIYDRFIIGVNFHEELGVIKSNGKIKNIEYYFRKKSKRPPELKNINDAISFFKENDIHSVSMPYEVVIKNKKEVRELRKNGIFIYSFTQDNIPEIIKIKRFGVNVIGTNTIFKWRL